VTSVLEAMAGITEWSQDLKSFLAELESSLKPNDQRAKALALLCRFHLGDLPLADLLHMFPKKNVLLKGWRIFDIKKDFEKIQTRSAASEKRAVARLIKVLEAPEDEHG
jgi:hypothetical protein